MEDINIRKPKPRDAPAVRKLAAAAVITAILVGAGAYWWYRSAVRDLRMRLESQPTEYVSFTVYGADPYKWSATEDFSIAIPEGPPLAERVQILADALSRRRFGNLPIEIIGVEERDGKTIALVNLLESEMQRPSWRTGYFQGSTGGACTTIMLVETFLQKDYHGSWLDGVDFYYEGEPISDQWDHIHLSGTKYRQTTQASEPSPQ